MPISSCAQPKKVIDLYESERKVFSQNGEDGVLQAIFCVIGDPLKYYVEFGTESGEECNTRYFRSYWDWNGLMMDGTYENESINLRKEFITAENINDLFRKYNVPYEFELLSIDIDYNDFYVWNAIDDVYRPRVVVIEYNGSHLVHEDKVALYNPGYMWDQTNYYGASMRALYELGKKKGYTLVYANANGVNLFFIRSDILDRIPYEFVDAGDIEYIYKPAAYGIGPNGGHIADPYNRPYITSKEAMNVVPR